MELSFEELSLPDGITQRYQNINLKFVKSAGGFEIFDFYSGKSKASIGDDADYLLLFSTLAGHLPENLNIEDESLILASDSGGNRVFARMFTADEKEKYRYAYVALGAAVKELSESEINKTFGFFAEIFRESGKVDGFEKAANKLIRTMPEDSKISWERVISEKLDFIKTDLYAFHLLKLFSWSFQIVPPDGDVSSAINLVRPKPGKPRGANRK